MELRVEVLGGRNLQSMDVNGFSDPYCIIGIADPKTGEMLPNQTPHRSETRYTTLNPTWDKAAFSTESAEVKKVRIEVWDQDKDKKTDDFLGYVLVDTNFEQIKSVEAWMPLLARSNKDKVSGDINVISSRTLSAKNHPCVLFNHKQRMVRVFLSSTFVDMHSEREIIMRRVMVNLSKFCYERGVALTYIDMRWGISDDMVQKDHLTISRCLQEVEHSRPYFVCTVAQRYGWHQKTYGADEMLTKTFETAEKDFEWIKNFRTRSVTELEIQHGFLLNPALPEGHSFFYFRDDAYLDTLDQATKTKFKDVDTYAIDQLQELKTNIKKKADEGVCVLRNYNKPEDLEQILTNDLKVAIERDFPLLPETESLLHRYQYENENYAHQLRTVYIARESYYQTLNDVTKNVAKSTKGNFLVVIADSGSGKSSLLANWWYLQSTKKPKAPIFLHFIGASNLGSSFSTLLIRLFEDINSRLLAFERIPVPREEGLIDAIPKFLNAASAKGGLVIILDEIDQLPRSYHDLHWLPFTLPPRVHVILSCHEGGVLLSTKNRKWQQLQILPLDDAEKKELIKQRLAIYGKAITDANMKKLIDHKSSCIPLFLTTVLTELCIIGYYTAFQQQLDAMVACPDFPSLYKLIIERWEENFGKELVRDSLLLIAGARAGVLESTIQTITGALPASLFPMFSAMRAMLAVLQGKLTFIHTYLREAVLKRYSKENLVELQQKMVAHLKTLPFNANVATELPWLLSEIMTSPTCKNTKDVQNELAELLLNFQNLQLLLSKDETQFEVLKWWRGLAALDAKWHMGPLYVERATKVTKENARTLLRLSQFLLDASLFADAKKVAEFALSASKGTTNKAEIADAHQSLGDIQVASGKLDDAEDHFKDALALRTQQFGDSHPSVAAALASLGILYHEKDRLDEANKYLKQALEIQTQFAKGGNQILREVAKTLNNLAAIAAEEEDYDLAVKYSRDAVDRLTALLGEGHPEVATALSNLAVILDQKGDREESRQYFEKALANRVAVYGEEHLDVAQSHLNIGTLLFEDDDKAKQVQATAIFAKVLDMQIRLVGPDHPHVMTTLNYLANSYHQAHEYEQAVVYAKQALEKMTKTGMTKHNEDVKVLLEILRDSYGLMRLPEEAKKYEFNDFHG